MNSIKPIILLNTAIDASKKAGFHALNEIGRREEYVAIDSHDVKLVLDIECQKIAEESILQNFPEHSIIGEEGEKISSEKTYEWIIDPIDGTVNFTHGFSHWCCSIAVRYKGEVIAGAVFAPKSNDLYAATIDSPSTLNDQIIKPSHTSDISRSMVFTGLNQKTKKLSSTFDIFKDLALKTQKVRITGSAALDICHVAAGKTDAYLEFGIYLWDYAAAGLIAQQAGATVKVKSNFQQPAQHAMLCSTPGISDQLEPIWRAGIESL